MGLIAKDTRQERITEHYRQLATVPQYYISEQDMAAAQKAVKKDQRFNDKVGAKAVGVQDPKQKRINMLRGYTAEIAFAAWLSQEIGTAIDWEQEHKCGEYKARDVLGYQVRSTHDMSNGLAFRSNRYRPEDVFVFCRTARDPQGRPMVYIVGWRYGHEVLKHGVKKNSTEDDHEFRVAYVYHSLDKLPITDERRKYEHEHELPF
jgi:hypothetical protein